jgi:thioredoxin reductase (NADPH)
MKRNEYQLAIIGAGPAGIATAVESYLLGMRDIILIEKDEDHNATIRKFYKDNKRVDKDWKGQKVELDGNIYFIDGTKESTLDFFDKVIASHSVELQTHTEVHKIVKNENKFDIFLNGTSIRAKYVVVTIGRMGKPNRPSYKIPSGIKKNVDFSLENCSLDEKVLIVGGGDSAIEYAVELAEHNDVTICYRRETFRRANPINQADINQAIEKRSLKALLGTNIASLEEDNGKVLVQFEESPSDTFDRIIYAIGGTTPSAFLASSGITEIQGIPQHDENYQSSIQGLYVAGDITQERGGSIALGLNHGYKIAKHILANDTTLRRDDEAVKLYKE